MITTVLPNFPQRSRLTGQEMNVVCCLIHEMTNKEAARALNISPRTVEDYRAHIMSKLGVRNVAGLMRVVYQLH